MKIDSKEDEFRFYTGSPVTILLPNREKFRNEEFLPINKKHSDVKGNEVNFFGCNTVEAEDRNFTNKLNMLVTKRKTTKPLMSMHSLRELDWTIQIFENARNQSKSNKKNLGTIFEEFLKVNLKKLLPNLEDS